MKLPFLNRKRYIVLKAYTDHAGLYERAPLTIGKGVPSCPIKKSDFMKQEFSYQGCYSRIVTPKLSVTVPCPADIRISVLDGIATAKVAGNSPVTVDFDHDGDPAYGSNLDFFISKIIPRWNLEEKTGTHFVMARHMGNKTIMNVLSGVLEFKISTDINVFNLISKSDHQQTIPFLTPMASLYPLSDRPVHLECEYSKADYQRLSEINYRPHWNSDLIKSRKGKRH